MAAKPLFVGGTNPTGEIPVTGGSLSGKIMGMPQQLMSAPGGMFGGQGTAGSPTSPQAGGQPSNPQMPGAGAQAPGMQQQAGAIFGGEGMAGAKGGSQPDIMALLMQFLQQQPGMA